MTTFKSALAICGLSLREAADYLEVSYDTCKSWSQGRNAPPLGVWRDLARRYKQIEETGDRNSVDLDPETIPLRQLNNLQADDPDDPLSGHGPDIAGAMALLLALIDEDG